MGLSIGQSPGALGAVSGTSRTRSVALLESGARSRSRLPNEEEPSAFPGVRRNQNEAPRVGVGSGAASGPSIALTTVSRTVEQVNRNRPSLEELSLRSQDRAAQVRAQFQARLQERNEARESTAPERRPTSRVETPPAVAPRERPEVDPPFTSNGPNTVVSRLPNPAVQARSFISSINDAAATALARVGEGEAPEPSGGPTIQINGESFSFGNANTQRGGLNITA